MSNSIINLFTKKTNLYLELHTIFFMNIKHMRHSASHIVGVLLSKVIAFNLSNGLQIEVLANKFWIETSFLMGY